MAPWPQVENQNLSSSRGSKFLLPVLDVDLVIADPGGFIA